jgi:alginate production protein
MDFENVPALEIKGEWDSENSVFVAVKIEELPKERRPKLRGEIQKIDPENETITVYGIPIEIDDETQYSDSDGDFKSLKVGQRVEVSCKIREHGWEASKLKLKDVKDSDKIKGTVTRFSIDGESPDTLEIHGLIIILTEKTRIVEPTGFYEDKEDMLFGDLKSSKIYYDPDRIEVTDRILAYAEYRHTTRNNNEFDLSESYDGDNSDTEPEIRLEAIGNYNRHIQAFTQLRVRKKFYFNDQRRVQPPDDLEADLTQLYFLARNIGNRGFALQVGRQDFDEDREWLFDEYMDAVRLYYYGYGPLIIDAAYINHISPVKDKYETWTDFFWQARWMPRDNSMLSVYWLTRKDSDETRNREPVWFGARYYGEFMSRLRLWMEGALLDGEDKGQSLDARAMDLGITYNAMNIKFSPYITIAYAAGTGDENGGDNISNEFRQTGYQDNTDYFGGTKTVHYYGELLDPELSNLIITTMAVGIMPLRNISADLIYHKYKQHQPDDKLRSDLIDPPARPNTLSDDIGWEFDFILGVTNIWGRVDFSWVFGIFSPGQAFAPQKNAVMNKFNIKINL